MTILQSLIELCRTVLSTLFTGMLDLVLVVLLIVALLYYLQQKNKPILYYIDSADADFYLHASEIMRKSSIRAKHRIAETRDLEKAEISIRLGTVEEMDRHAGDREYYPSGKPIRFSYTWQRPKPHILIDPINWSKGVPESGLTLSEYREYVIQHEFLHGLGYDHQPCNADTAVGGRCPILYQSTRGPPKGFLCGYTVQPADYQKRITGAYF